MTVITRRGLIQIGAALAASGLAVRKASAFGRAPGIQLRAMVVEAGPSEVEAVRRAAKGCGLPVGVVSDDLGPYYLRELSQVWKSDDQVAIGGLTHATTLFYLENLAWSASRIRIVFLGRHALHDGARVHALQGPQVAIDRFYRSARVLDWRIAIVRALTEVPRVTPVLKPVSAVRDAVIKGDRALFSWVIAPVSDVHTVLA
jgi:hypothetical protein